MAERLSILLEIMAVIVCIHCLYNRKVRFDISTIALYLSCVIIFELENVHGLFFGSTALPYLLVIVYCKQKCEDSFIGSSFCTFLMMVMIAIMQFFFSVGIDLLFNANASEIALYTNLLVLGSSIFLLPRFKIYRLRAYVKKWNSFLISLSVFIACIILYMQFKQRKTGKIQLLLFVFAIPMLAVVLGLMIKWLTEEKGKYDAENELQITRSMQERYDELVKAVQLRQHEFKNHIAAVYAMHYTYKSYDTLVKAQIKYCRGVAGENRYNDLLSLGDAVLAGFLYEKFCEIEESGVEVKFAIKGKLQNYSVSVHYLIEIIAILMDNASQAVQNSSFGKLIQFEFFEDAEKYYFKISNPFPYVSYDEIEAWFQIGKSTKGKGRGLGLCRVRRLCGENGCSILYKNREVNGKNWIEFIFITGKADKT